MACQKRVLDREMAAEPSPSLASARHVEHRGREHPAPRAPQEQLCRVVGHELLLLLEMSRCRMPSIATRKGWAAAKMAGEDRLPREVAAAGHVLHLPAAARSAAEAVSEVRAEGVESHGLAGPPKLGKKSAGAMWPRRMRWWPASSATIAASCRIRHAK